jgi:hypothetical protein
MTRPWQMAWLLVLTGCAEAATAADAGDAPARPSPTEPFGLRITTAAECLDVPSSEATIYDDARLWRVGDGGVLAPSYDDVARLPGGADDVLGLRRDVESAGLLDVPEGSYRGEPDACQRRTLRYRHGGRVLAWTIAPSADGPAPPRALTAALERADAVIATTPRRAADHTR